MSTAETETELVLLSGGDRAALLEKVDRLSAQLAAGHGFAPEAFACQAGDDQRLAVVAPPGALAERLAMARARLAGFGRNRLAIRDKGIYFGCGEGPGRIAFLFPGEGSQRVGMLRQAYERLSPVRVWLDSLDEAYRQAGEVPPSHLIYPPAGTDSDTRALFDIGHGGQLGTVFNLALHELITDLGIRPDAVLGHSNGEHAAVMVACMNPTTDREYICNWLRRASRDGVQLGLPAAPERMAAVGTTRRTVLDGILARFPGELFLAMENCPLQQVIGGRMAAITEAAVSIVASGGMCGMLPFERAYHTPLFADWAAMLERHYRDLPLAAPRLPIFSCLTGAAIPTDPDSVRQTLVRQWTAPVRLRAAVEAMYESGVRTFIEVGPDNKLSAFVSDTLRGQPHLAAATASAQRGDLDQLHTLLAALHAHGVTFDPARLRLRDAPRQADRPIPPDAVAAQTALINAARASMERMARLYQSACQTLAPVSTPAPRGALLRAPLQARQGRLVATQRLARSTDPFLVDHSLGRPPGPALSVLSFTTSLALAAEVARAVSGAEGAIAMRDLRATRWLALDGGSLDVHIEAERCDSTVKVALSDADTLPAFSVTVAFESAPACDAPEEAGGPPPLHWTPARFYRDYAFHGPSFQGLQRVTAITPQGIAAELRVTHLPGIAQPALEADPALLDCAGQLVAFWLLEHGGLAPTVGVFPYAARRVVLHRPPPPGSLVHCQGSIAFHDGVRTEASFVFTAAGQTVALIEGLEQRVIELPAALANWVFGARDMALSQAGADGARRLNVAEWHDALGGQNGIWARALAPLMLDEAELARWLPDSDTARLLTLITAKEAARDWARKHGLEPPPLNTLIVEDGRCHCPAFEITLDVQRTGDALTVTPGENVHV